MSSTYYSSKRQFETYGAYRAKMVLDVDKSNTSVKVSWHIYAQMQYKWGVGVGIKMTGADSGSDTGFLSSNQGGSSEWKNAASKSGSATFSRGTSSSSKTFKATAYGASVSGHSAAGGSPVSVSHTITIPALEDYTIKYSANGGSGAPSSQTKYYGRTLTLSSKKPTRTGYDFVGWGLSSGDTKKNYDPGDKYTANKSDTLYAIWRKKTYTIKYSANGGSNSGNTSQTKYYGTTLKLFAGSYFSRPGYTLIGWGTSSSGGVRYKLGGSYTANSDDTLYAIWKAKTYTITYNVNGGQSYHSKQTKTYGTSLKLYSDAPKREGYKFIRWDGSDKNKYSVGSTYTGNANLTLTAVWENNTNWMLVGYYDSVTGNYIDPKNPNNASKARKNLTIGNTVQLLPDIPNRFGFIGWSKKLETLQPYTVLPDTKFSTRLYVPAGNVDKNQRYAYGVYRDISPSKTKILNSSIVRVDSDAEFNTYIKAIEENQLFDSVTSDTDTLFGYLELSDSFKNVIISKQNITIIDIDSDELDIEVTGSGNNIYIRIIRANSDFKANEAYTVNINCIDTDQKPISYSIKVSRIATIFDLTREGQDFVVNNNPLYNYIEYPITFGPRVKFNATTINDGPARAKSLTGAPVTSAGGETICLLRTNEYNETVLGGYEISAQTNNGGRGNTYIFCPEDRNIMLGSSSHPPTNVYTYGTLRPQGNVYIKDHLYIHNHTGDEGYVGYVEYKSVTDSVYYTSSGWKHLTGCSISLSGGTWLITTMARITGTVAGDVYGLAVGYRQNSTNYLYTYSRTSIESNGGIMQFTTQYIASFSSSATFHPAVYMAGKSAAKLTNRMVRAVRIA